VTTGKCSQCGATVLWSQTTKGSRIPLNPLTIKTAVIISRNDHGEVVTIQPAHTIHLDTCRGKPASQRTRA